MIDPTRFPALTALIETDAKEPSREGKKAIADFDFGLARILDGGVSELIDSSASDHASVTTKRRGQAHQVTRTTRPGPTFGAIAHHYTLGAQPVPFLARMVLSNPNPHPPRSSLRRPITCVPNARIARVHLTKQAHRRGAVVSTHGFLNEVAAFEHGR